MPLPPFLTKIFSGGAGELISKIGDTVDKLTMSKEEKEQFKENLLKLTNEHIEKMQGLAQAETDSYLKDVDSARNMQIGALKQEDKFAKRFIYYLAIGVMSFAFVFDMCLFFIQYPERNHDLVNMVCGTINLAGFGAVISFFFGSSKSSHNKQETIDALKNR